MRRQMVTTMYNNYMYTAISINVVGSKLKAKRQDRKVVWVVLNLFSEARQGR